MSRKDLSFKQLVSYFEKEDVADRFAWNLYSTIENKEEIIKEFMDNAEYIKKARGSVYMYHEVLSLQENNLNLERQKEILQELTKLYVQKRADEHLLYGVIHQDTSHIHMHLMISSNKIAHNKRVRLSKSELAQIQAEVEQYKNIKFKDELEPTYHYQKDRVKTKEKIKESVKEQEIKHRRKKQTKKEWINEQLKEIFDKSLSNDAMEKSLKAKGFKIYTRKTTSGVTFENKKYRFKTLGLEQTYKQTLARFEKREQRQEKRQEFKQQNSKRKANSNSNTYTQNKSKPSDMGR